MLNKIILIVILIYSFQANAQGLVSGLGATYGSDIKSVGYNIREYMFIGHKICFGPEVSYFPKDKLFNSDEYLFELNITGHYLIELKENFVVYPLIGINYSYEKEVHHEHLVNESAFGLSIGYGIHYKVKNLFPFIEYKYIVGDLAQHVYSVGVLFSLKSEKHHE